MMARALDRRPEDVGGDQEIFREFHMESRRTHVCITLPAMHSEMYEDGIPQPGRAIIAQAAKVRWNSGPAA
jgi:hypothetical protein